MRPTPPPPGDAGERGPDDGPRPVHQTVELARTGLSAGLLALVVATLLLISDAAPTIGLVVAVTVAVGLLLTHSLSVRVDEEELELRMGNGWRRRRVRLDDVDGVRVETGCERLFAFGRRSPDGIESYGLGGRGRVHLRLVDGALVVIALDEPTDLAASLTARRHDRQREGSA